MAQQTIQIADKPTLDNVNETTLSMLQMLSSYDCEVSTLPYDFKGGSAVVLDDEIHILGGSGDKTAHYKWDYTNAKWTRVSTLPFNLYYGSAVVLDGEIHILGGSSDKTAHYKFDGTTWTSVSTLPYDFKSGSAVVLNGEIHILGGFGDNTAHYKFDGTTWTSVSTLPYKLTYYYKLNVAVTLSCYGSAVVLNGEIHILGGFKEISQGAITLADFHYKWNGTEWVEVSTLPQGYSEYSAVALDGEIHILCGANRYIWNGTEWSEALSLPCTVSESSAVVLNNQIHLLGGEYNSNSHHVLVLNTSSLNDIYTLLNNSTYGLHALKLLQDTYDNHGHIRYETIINYLTDGGYGLGAIRTLLDVNDANMRTNIGDIKWLLQNDTIGLYQIKTAVMNSRMPKLVYCHAHTSTATEAESVTYSFTGQGKIIFLGKFHNEYGQISITSLSIDGGGDHYVNVPLIFDKDFGSYPYPIELEYNDGCTITLGVFNAVIYLYQYQYVTS